MKRLQSGQGTVEYATALLVLVTLVVDAIVALLGPQVGWWFCLIVNALLGGPFNPDICTWL